MTELRRRMIQDMNLAGFTDGAQQNYISAVCGLAAVHEQKFVVILDRVRDEKAAGRIAARLGSELRRPIGLEGREFSVSASVGIVLGRAGEGDPAGLLHAADAAMYQAKSLGGGRHVVFDKRTCPLVRPKNGPQ